MKVITGFLKGRNITGYNIEGTRPTMDRVKESVFSMINGHLNNVTVLDLFAGSGNYGIEAISEGAKVVYFNDKNKECTKIIKKNIDNFNINDKSIILNMDYWKCLNYCSVNNITFDLVFLDPPYKEHIIEPIIMFLIKNNMLNKNAYLIAEFEGDKLKSNYHNLILKKMRNYGKKEIYIFEYKGDKNE